MGYAVVSHSLKLRRLVWMGARRPPPDPDLRRPAGADRPYATPPAQLRLRIRRWQWPTPSSALSRLRGYRSGRTDNAGPRKRRYAKAAYAGRRAHLPVLCRATSSIGRFLGRLPGDEGPVIPRFRPWSHFLSTAMRGRAPSARPECRALATRRLLAAPVGDCWPLTARGPSSSPVSSVFETRPIAWQASIQAGRLMHATAIANTEIGHFDLHASRRYIYTTLADFANSTLPI
jgi:hypothetical protein